MSYANAVMNQSTQTTNGMKARVSTANFCLDLFSKIGSARNMNIIPLFISAYNENREYALRTAMWARDVRGGAGERKVYRDIMLWLEQNHPEDAKVLANKTPLVGRWDDIFIFKNSMLQTHVFEMIEKGLLNKDGLLAKWLPRKGDFAINVRNFLNWSPKRYRKAIVELSKTVEQLLCAKEFDKINFSHVPSVANKKYRKTFFKHQETRYKEYIESVLKGSAKMNASAIFPHDVISALYNREYDVDMHESNIINATLAQWESLPNYLGDNKVLPIVDSSASMTWFTISPQSKIDGFQIAMSLGLYCADKNTGAFKNVIGAFSDKGEVAIVNGNIAEKMIQVRGLPVGGSTNLEAMYKKILQIATENKVSQEDMPNYLLIFSDMQFNQAVSNPNHSAQEMIKDMFNKAGYKLPKVIYWNLDGRHANTPVRFDESGAAIVSGFSPAVLKSVLADTLTSFTPENVMLDAIMKDKYNI